MLPSSPCSDPRPCVLGGGSRAAVREREENKETSTRSSRSTRKTRPLGRFPRHYPLALHALAWGRLLQISPPQNLAIKTPSPRPQLHRKRNPSGLGPACRVHFPWISNIRPSLPCAQAELSPTVMTRMPTATRTAVEKMAKGPARDSAGLCRYRKHHDFLNPQRPSICLCLCFANRRSRG